MGSLITLLLVLSVVSHTDIFISAFPDVTAHPSSHQSRIGEEQDRQDGRALSGDSLVDFREDATAHLKSRDSQRGLHASPGRKGKQFLSSNPRWHAKKAMSLWDYDRHSKRVGHFDPLVGHNWVPPAHPEVELEHLASRGASVVYVRDPSAQPGPDTIENPARTPTLRQGLVLEHGQPHPGRPLASSTDEESRRQTLVNLGGLVTFDILSDDHFDAAWPHKRDEDTTDQPDSGSPKPDITGDIPAVSVLDGGTRMYADKIIWQPTSDHPKPNELSRRRKDDDGGDEEWDDGDDGQSVFNGGEAESRGRKSNRYEALEKDQVDGESSHKKGSSHDEDSGHNRNSEGRGVTHDEDYEDDEPSGRRGKGNKYHSEASDYEDLDSDTGRHHADSSGFDRAGTDSDVAYEDDDRQTFDPDRTDKDRAFAPGRHARPTYDDGQYRPFKSFGDDCAALVSFYQAMRGDSWSGLSDWSDPLRSRAGCCDWIGVTCDPYDRVVIVDLAGAGLEGGLSDELFSLESLVRLDVSNNNLTLLPDRFEALPMLANFNASRNSLSGPVPESLLSHDMLKTLSLASNSLTGQITIDSINITSLSLAQNDLSSITIAEGRSLRKVDLSENAFQGQLPDVSRSIDLQIFDASFNNFTGPLVDLSRLTSLTRLDVRSNALTGLFPSTFRHLTHLTSLYLSSNSFAGPVPSEPAPPALRSCYLMPNAITPCPSAIELAHPESLASVCHVKCPTAHSISDPSKPAGIPVSPLPGEAGLPFDIALSPGSSTSRDILAKSGPVLQPSLGPAVLSEPPSVSAARAGFRGSGMNASMQGAGESGRTICSGGERSMPATSLPWEMASLVLFLAIVF